MARTLYLVCYDVCNPRRLARVAKFVRGYRVAGQKSCHECWITPTELAEIRSRLEELVNPEEDRVHILQLDPRLTVRCHGVAQSWKPQPFMVV